MDEKTKDYIIEKLSKNNNILIEKVKELEIKIATLEADKLVEEEKKKWSWYITSKTTADDLIVIPDDMPDRHGFKKWDIEAPIRTLEERADKIMASIDKAKFKAMKEEWDKLILSNKKEIS